MRSLLVAASTLVCSLATMGLAHAQGYPQMQPVPRTTDSAKLAEVAQRREIRERIELGFREELRGDWKAAGAEFTRVLALNPREPQGSTAHYDLALAQANLGLRDAAALSFRAAIALDPGFMAARVNLIAVELTRNDLVAARRAAEDLLERDPDSARGLYERGLIALRAGDAAAALQDFGRLLRVDPSYATARYDLALAEMKLNRYDDAERDLRDTLAIAPAFARARFALGAVFLRTGKRDQARLAFEQVVQSAQDPSLRELATSLRDSLKN
jgi:tetratricopeptide (TPR) repeat protein